MTPSFARAARTRWAVWACWLACCAGPAGLAAPACAAPTSGTTADEALAQGRAALARQDWAQAELLLERALLLRPESAEVLIELAQLLAARGRLTEASAMLGSLAADPRTPAAHAQALQSAIEQLQKAAAADRLAQPPSLGRPSNLNSGLNTGLSSGLNAASNTGPSGAMSSSGNGPPPNAWRYRAEAQAGYSSNPLVVTSASAITLTLPDGAFQLPLEGRPRASSYAGLTLAALSARGSEFFLQAQQVALQGQGAAFRSGVYWPVYTANPEGSASFKASLLARAQRYGDGTRRHQFDLQATTGPLVAQLGVYEEPDRLRHGTAWRLDTGLPLPAPLRERSREAYGAVWLEGETNRDQGAPGHQAAGARVGWQLAPGWSVQAQLHAQRDTRGYSPLLESNARRTLLTHHLAVEARLSGTPTQGWRIRLYDARRLSNMPLFSWRDTGMQLIWRKDG